PTWGGPYCFYIYSPTDIRPTPGDLPETFALSQNYPNPFNPTTEIKFDVPTRSHTTLKVYNILGQEVETLIDEDTPAGRYVAEWDASQYSSGVYFYKINAGDFVDTKKMVLVK
ncbi:MAG: T9SS type A sorting domain-containing protein, partial [bacterium]